MIRHRRSIFPKHYTAEKVNDSIIEEMLENANFAPSHKLTEPWRFSVFKGDGLRMLAEFQGSKHKERFGQTQEINQAKYEKLLTSPLRCSHIISIGMKRNEVVPEQEEIAAVSCAAQNMLLTAAAYGLGCYWSTGGVTYYPGINDFFGLGEQDLLLGFLFIGSASEVLYQGRRKAVEDKTKWVV